MLVWQVSSISSHPRPRKAHVVQTLCFMTVVPLEISAYCDKMCHCQYAQLYAQESRGVSFTLGARDVKFTICENQFSLYTCLCIHLCLLLLLLEGLVNLEFVCVCLLMLRAMHNARYTFLMLVVSMWRCRPAELRKLCKVGVP